LPRQAARWLATALSLLIAACGTTIQPTQIRAPPSPEVISTRLMALLIGQLVMVNQCLRVQASYGPDSFLLVWPADFEASVNGDMVQVTDMLLKKQATWHLGDTLQVAGGEIPGLDPSLRPVPANCSGPYWVVGDVGESSTPTPALTSTPAPTIAATPTVTPPPGVTELAQDGLVTFTSTVFGLTFSYRPVQFGANVRTLMSGDKVYVYYTDAPPTNGQYVQVFHKAPADSLRQAIQTQFLAGVSPKDCPIVDNWHPSEAAMPQSDVFAAIMLPLALDNHLVFDVATAEVEAQKCPPTYTQNGGSAYFMEDTRHPDRFFFFKIGQYWIYSAGSPQHGYPWQDTLRVIDASQ
jgi:hypothetical protein